MMGVALTQLAQQFSADIALAQPYHIGDVAAAVISDHVQAAADGINLEVVQVFLPEGFQGQFLGASSRRPNSSYKALR
jgi:hypothetical protein